MRLAAAVAATLADRSHAGAPVVEDLRLVGVRGGSALVIRLSADATLPTVTPVRAASGALQRLHVDLPPGTRLADGVPRVVTGDAVIRRARAGMGDEGQVRLVLDVAAGRRFIARTDGRRRISVAVAAATGRSRAAPDRRPRPDARAPAGEVVTPPAVAAPATAARTFRIVLDPGHGGDDPGAIGFVVEKHVTLDVVRRLARRLREDLGAEVVLTRSGDATVPLAERTAIANQARADLFVSVHANSNAAGRSKGIETYVLDDSDEAATVRLAAIENATAAGPVRRPRTDLRYILSSLVQGGKMPDSSRLATAVHEEILGHMRARYDGVKDLGVKRGPFYVLVGSHAPCILIELSFVNHPLEGRRLGDQAYRAALADGLAHGIRRFLRERRRAQTL